MEPTPIASRRVSALALSLALAATSLTFACGAAEAIRIGGTGNALGTLRLLAEEFGRRNPGAKVTVLPSLGSSGAIKAVPQGAVDIGLTSRPLNDEERKLGAVSTEYARAPLVFAVSTRTQVWALTYDEVTNIYDGKMVKWQDGELIRPILRPAGDDNTRQVRQMSPAIDRALTAAERRPGFAFATTDQEAAAKMEDTPGALGATTLSLILSERRTLRALALNGVEPTADNGASGKYPHAKRFFFITKSAPSAEVRRFLAFVESAPGRDILRKTGHWIP